MKKRILSLLFLSLIFTLTACSNSEYKAEESMIEDALFVNQGGQNKNLFFVNDELTIKDESKDSLDVKEYGKYKLSTKGDTFSLTFDDGSQLTFKRVGERLIEDEEGTVYQPR